MWLTDPDDPRVHEALEWTCDVCKAQKKHLCTNSIEPGKPLPGRVVHVARTVDRRRHLYCTGCGLPHPKGKCGRG